MSLQATPAHSSRITKPRRKSAVAALGLKRKNSSPSTAIPKRLSLPSSASTSHDDDQLDDTGVIASLANDLNLRDVPQYMEYIRNSMFSSMPEKAGMNSTRIAEVLNFRRRLPPFVTIAHIDALSRSSTRVEREIAELVQGGILRRVLIPNRGIGAAAVGDGIVSVREWQSLVQANRELPEDVKCKLRISTKVVTKVNACKLIFHVTSKIYIHHGRQSSINVDSRHNIHVVRAITLCNYRFPHVCKSFLHNLISPSSVLWRTLFPHHRLVLWLTSRIRFSRCWRRPNRYPTHPWRHYLALPLSLAPFTSSTLYLFPAQHGNAD
jgi:hypothetical protein